MATNYGYFLLPTATPIYDTQLLLILIFLYYFCLTNAVSSAKFAAVTANTTYEFGG